MNDSVRALTVFDADTFTFAGGVLAHNIARWNGSRWSTLGSGMNFAVHDLAVHDDGSGPALYAGGDFRNAGGIAVNRIARWNGASWSAVGGGVVAPGVARLLVHDDGGGPALYAGGGFTRALDSGDGYLARWGCPDQVPPVISCPPPISAPDRNFDGQEVVFFFFTVTATDGVDPAPVVVCVPNSGSTFPLGTTIVDCTATDALGNQSTCQFTVTVAHKARRR